VVWFGFEKFITSSIRWLLHIPFAFYAKFLILTPPFFSRQVILNLTDKSIFSLTLSSYFDWATLHEIFVRREYDTKFFSADKGIQGEYESILTSGKTPLILDLGANVGVASIFFSKKYPSAKVVGLEPSEKNANSAKANLAKLPNAEIICCAVSSEDGEIDVFDPGLGNNAFRTFGEDNDLVGKVQAKSIPSLLARYSQMRPYIVKIDVEGFESNLFQGETSWIDSFKVIAIEIHDWMLPGQAISSNLMKALGGKNRDLVFRGENWFSVRND
jgi:FkbM family methyltransferase